MKKGTIPAIIAIIVIVGAFGYSLLNVYAANNLQFRWYQEGGFGFIQLMNEGKVELCNASPVSLDLKRIEIEPYHRNGKIGTYYVDSTIFEPFESKEVFGNTENVNKQLVTVFLNSNLGKASSDYEKINVDVKMHVPILGVIPYTIEKTHSGSDFVSIMNHEKKYSC